MQRARWASLRHQKALPRVHYFPRVGLMQRIYALVNNLNAEMELVCLT